MKKLGTILIVGILLIVLVACGGATVTPDMPPEILYGEDVCDQCNMIISDERFAAGLVVELEPGEFEHRIFDDIGDLLAYEKAHGENSPLPLTMCMITIARNGLTVSQRTTSTAKSYSRPWALVWPRLHRSWRQRL
ncbi:MAG: hypothetical protein R2932_19510 [Caldilineaceae bacterium]